MRKKSCRLTDLAKLSWMASLLLAGLLFLPLNQASAAEFMIDDFSVEQGSAGNAALTIVDTDALKTKSATVTGSIANLIGGNRFIEITQTAAQGAGATTSFVDGGTLPGFNVANTANVTGRGRVVWSGSSDPNAFGLNADFSNLQYVLFLYLKCDHTSNYHFTVWTDATHASMATIPMDPNSQPSTEVRTNVKVPNDFPWVAVGSSGGAQFSTATVKRMELRADAAQDLDQLVQQITYVTATPSIACVSKTWSLNPSYADQQPIINLPSDQTFPVTLYAELTVQNTGLGSDYVYIEDTIPTLLSKSGATEVVLPDPTWNLGESNPATGSGLLKWTSGATLGASATLQFRFPVEVSEFTGTKTNTFAAKGLSETVFTNSCSATVTHAPTGKVPSLTEWGVILLSLILAVSAVLLLRRKRSIS